MRWRRGVIPPPTRRKPGRRTRLTRWTPGNSTASPPIRKAAGLGGFLPYELPSHNHRTNHRLQGAICSRRRRSGDGLAGPESDPRRHGGKPAGKPHHQIQGQRVFQPDPPAPRHGGTSDGGNGWIFSDMAIATSFNDFVVVRFWQTWWFRGLAALFVLAGVGATVRVVEKRKYQLQLQRAEQERALEQERARIAQDLHDELGSSLTRISLLGGLLRADKDNPNRWRRTPANFPSPPTRPSARWRKSSGRCGPAATRCKAWWTTSRILPTNCLRATRRAAGWICRTTCPRGRCRRTCATTFFSSSRRR